MDIGTLTLEQGSHKSRDAGMCVMEATAYVAGEPHSDHPACVCPTIAACLRRWNDDLPTDADRVRLLRPLIPAIIGTNTGTADAETRAWLICDWLVREYLPAWLDLAGGKCAPHAATLRSLPEATAQTIGVAQAAIHAARDATRAATRAAAWVAARAAAWDAAWAAARAAAWDAARAAALAAARDAAGYAARAAAGYAAWDAAGDAAWAAALDAAGDAAGDALLPTVASVQQSAVALVHRMCAVGRAMAVLEGR